ncbi:MAG: acetolactate synthase large subunit [Hyphomicrobiales bacterium]|nr:acetolactate synthase large subunit [Hyphomicrobiales bacterium]
MSQNISNTAGEGITGAQSLLETLLACGVEACFANPGTSELHLVGALQHDTRMRSVLCLYEGVATGAADGYARIAGKPAATLLHLGPGLANGWANLHNAKRAKAPVVNVVGDHATWHLPLGASLTSDLEGLSNSISDWTKYSASTADIATDVTLAVQAAMANSGQIATLVLPADTTWSPGGAVGKPLQPLPHNQVAGSAIDAAAKILTSGRRVALLTTGDGMEGRGREACTRIAAKTGAAMFCHGLNRRMERGAGRMAFRRLSAWGQESIEVLSAFDDLIIVGTGRPVLGFAHPTFKSVLIPEGMNALQLGQPEDDIASALEMLADAVGAGPGTDVASMLVQREHCELGAGKLNAEVIGRAINKFMPENAIISDESGTAGGGHFPFTANAAPHDALFLTGGSIGQGLPVALGAAIAAPDRKVVCLEADGSGMYTLQALWSMARERCDVTTVICSNRTYGILMRSVGMYNIPGLPNTVPQLFDLSNPDLNWAKMAEGMGVEGHVCTTAEEFNRVFEDCMKRKGPNLIEAVV